MPWRRPESSVGQRGMPPMLPVRRHALPMSLRMSLGRPRRC
ncbi:MAG: hypothetical protein R3A44_08560 [Caldilineaceae bacterium]